MKLASVLPLSTPPSMPESPKSLQFQVQLYKANALTEADRPTASSSSSQPAIQSRFYPIWRRALFKIKVRKVLRTINEELLVFGTGHDLIDLNEQYKENIDELITRKVNKQESFRKESLSTEAGGEYKGLLHPDHLFKRLWNGLLALLMIYTAVIMPYRLAFSEQIFWDGWTILEVTVDGVFLADVGVNFFSITVNEDGTFETNRWKVACDYLRKWFLIDIISCFPASLIDYISGGDSMPEGKYNNLVRLARLPRLYKLLRIVRIVKVLKHYSGTPFFERCQDCMQLNSRKSPLRPIQTGQVPYISDALCAHFRLYVVLFSQNCGLRFEYLGCAEWSRGQYNTAPVLDVDILGSHDGIYSGVWRHCAGNSI